MQIKMDAGVNVNKGNSIWSLLQLHNKMFQCFYWPSSLMNYSDPTLLSVLNETVLVNKEMSWQNILNMLKYVIQADPLLCCFTFHPILSYTILSCLLHILLTVELA